MVHAVQFFNNAFSNTRSVNKCESSRDVLGLRKSCSQAAHSFQTQELSLQIKDRSVVDHLCLSVNPAQRAFKSLQCFFFLLH